MPRYNPATNGYYCDKCEEPAVVNFATVWARYPVSEDGEFGVAESLWDWETPGEENLFFCDKHEREWVESG